MTIACLKTLGMIPVASDLMTISVNIGSADSRLFFSKNVGIGPKAYALDGELRMNIRSSSDVIGGNAVNRYSFNRFASLVRRRYDQKNSPLIFSIFVLKNNRKTHWQVNLRKHTLGKWESLAYLRVF